MRKPQEGKKQVDAELVEGDCERILIAEGDEAVRNAAVDMVSELGHSFLGAENADPALRLGKVLIVEDIALIRMTTADMVKEVGFQVVEAGSAEEALSTIHGDPEISILLTDIGLPGMTGLQLIDEVVKLRPDLKIIVASGYSSERHGKEIRACAVQLIKPFDIEQLRRALELP
jgi:CheY-like chemotaxis protein